MTWRKDRRGMPCRWIRAILLQTRIRHDHTRTARPNCVNGDAAASREQIFTERAETASPRRADPVESGSRECSITTSCRAGYAESIGTCNTPHRVRTIHAAGPRLCIHATETPTLRRRRRLRLNVSAANCRLPLFNRPDRIARTYRFDGACAADGDPCVVAPRAERFTSADSDLVQKILTPDCAFR